MSTSHNERLTAETCEHGKGNVHFFAKLFIYRNILQKCTAIYRVLLIVIVPCSVPVTELKVLFLATSGRMGAKHFR